MGRVEDVFEVVHRQRACREFRDDPVSDDVVERVLEAATFAPSAENRQPWVFVVVRDAETRLAIGRIPLRRWPPHLRMTRTGAPTRRSWASSSSSRWSAMRTRRREATASR